MNSPYQPIRDYAAIGNLRSVALVGRDGSIDWCCFPHLDRGSVFAALLDHAKGGRFRIGPNGGGRGEQKYIEDTNIVVTTFKTDTGQVSITDLMPIEGTISGLGASYALPWIHRIIESRGGRAEVEVEWSPRFDYARKQTVIMKTALGWLAQGEGERLFLSGLDNGEIIDGVNGPVLRAVLALRDGEKCVLCCEYGSAPSIVSLDSSMRLLQTTTQVWRRWVHHEGVVRDEQWATHRLPLVPRSELVLKMLSHADTGAIAAAPTTSLPETMGGVRNWDYRFTRIRDAALTAQALTSLGHSDEALGLLDWTERTAAADRRTRNRLQIMYGIHGETHLPEQELTHLEGYRGSRPVNIGNGAADQLQLEVYGELFTTAYELARRGHRLDKEILNLLGAVAQEVVAVRHKPDSGIWEIRGEPRHFTYSKVMTWVALDRATKLARDYGLTGNTELWAREMDEIKDEVLKHGFDSKLGAFTMAYDRPDLDAANLRIGLLEFLPHDDPRVQGTIDRTMEKLLHKGLVYRYKTDDGLPGKEGAFGLCTFWLVDALTLSNRFDEALEIYDAAANHANHVGLFSEQFDSETGEFLGNFPQAFTHIGLINSALYLAYAEGKPLPEHALIGTPEHREERRTGVGGGR